MEIKLLGLLWDVVHRKPLQLTAVFERLTTETSKLIDVERLFDWQSNYSSSRKSKVVLSIILEESVHGIASSIWFTEWAALLVLLLHSDGPLMSNHQNKKKGRRPLCHLCRVFSFLIAFRLTQNSRLIALPLQLQKVTVTSGKWSSRWQLHAWHESISSGRQGKSLTQFEESPRMAVSKDKETVTKQLLLTTNLPNLWVIRISHFLYLS